MAEAGFVAALDAAVVRFPGRPDIGPIDLRVHGGEIVALVGASGAGKSTVLNLLAGLRAPDAGNATPPPRGRVGMVFQAPTLRPWSDALSEVALPLEIAGAHRSQARARALVELSAVGLADRAATRPGALSGGMAMRVALARALVTEPDLLLLDEPFGALDTVTRRRLGAALHERWAARDPRPGVVFVTHDVEEAVHLAQRVVVLAQADGRPVAEIACPGPLPRPQDWRVDPAFRDAAERVAGALAAAMIPEAAA